MQLLRIKPSESHTKLAANNKVYVVTGATVEENERQSLKRPEKQVDTKVGQLGQEPTARKRKRHSTTNQGCLKHD